MNSTARRMIKPAKEIQEEFIKFLEDNGVLEKFKKNFSERVKFESFEEFLNRPTAYNQLEISFFERSFSWKFTDEGHNFWSNLNTKWRKYIVGVNNE